MLRPIYTECFVSLADPSQPVKVFDDGITIRVEDEAGGPFLVVRGRVEGLKEGEFAFNDAAEIDQFAAICKALLAQAGTE